MTNMKNLDTNLLDINQMTFTSTDSIVYEIEYFKNLDGVNSLYLVFNGVDAYFERIDENKYFLYYFFAITDKDREILENYKEIWTEMKDEIETIRGIEPIRYEKDFRKIKFESNYDLPLGEIINIPVCVIVARSVFQENGKYYPQIYLKYCFYEYEHENEDDSYVIY